MSGWSCLAASMIFISSHWCTSFTIFNYRYRDRSSMTNWPLSVPRIISFRMENSLQNWIRWVAPRTQYMWFVWEYNWCSWYLQCMGWPEQCFLCSSLALEAGSYVVIKPHLELYIILFCIYGNMLLVHEIAWNDKPRFVYQDPDSIDTLQISAFPLSYQTLSHWNVGW